jgi:hypothetical protein
MKFIAIMGIALILLNGCVNQPAKPEGNLANPLRIHYFECSRCGSLDGGCYGKNSVSSWRSETGKKCRHRWQEIGKAEFDRQMARKSRRHQTLLEDNQKMLGTLATRAPDLHVEKDTNNA